MQLFKVGMKDKLLQAHAFLTDQGKRNTDDIQTTHPKTKIPDLLTYESRTFANRYCRENMCRREKTFASAEKSGTP